ncbi:MAG: glycosyltransferase family 4 protein [Cyanobacteriota bacterium]|jgi:colanic acid/amylovoran biosynthesis glycosyltransferase
MGLNRLRSLPGPIAFANYSKDNDVGGVTTWMESLLLRLHADGIPVVLLLVYYGSVIPEVGVWSRLRSVGIPVEIEAIPLEEEVFHPRRHVKKILDFLNRHRPQIFLPNCRNILYFSAKIAGLQGLPWVFTVHADDPSYWSVAQATQVKLSKGSYVAISRHIASRLREKQLDPRPYVIPHGVPLSLEVARFSGQCFKVVYTGRITEEAKRISLVLQTMALACKADSRIECWLIGEGPEEPEARAWVKQQGLTDRIHFVGRLDVSEVRKRVRDYQAILLMSDYEGLGISLLEAMACAVVPVARTLPAVAEFVKHQESGLLVDANPDQAAAAIIRLLNDRSLWLHCSEGARLMVANEYSEDLSYQRWVDLLSERCESSVVHYPLKTAMLVPIPLRYEPLLLGMKNMALAWRWRLIRVWYQRILPVLALPKKLLRQCLH